jgi:diaminohydroxyphosphoribosylaminopyrimidine deaminase/5-amino-6-(5-phosphoribosylamino)uracil reductase
MGAVLVGRATAELDDPLLTARIPGVRNQPLRIVLDPDLKLPTDLKVFDASAPTLRVAGEPKVADLSVARLEDGGLDLGALLRELFARGATGLLVEGGARTVGSFLRAGLVDRMELFVAPKLLADGLPAVLARAADSLEASPKGNWLGVRRVGPDLRLTLDLRSIETTGSAERP